MSNCAVCGKHVKSGIVVHSECMELLRKAQQVDNKPLTIEELREMDGEPVWVADKQRWGILEYDDAGFVLTLDHLHWAIGIGGLELYRRKPNDWISVERRLPPDPDENIEDDIELPEYIVMVRGATESTVMHYAGNGEWIYGGDPYHVTHWMPLPEPPEVE